MGSDQKNFDSYPNPPFSGRPNVFRADDGLSSANALGSVYANV